MCEIYPAEKLTGHDQEEEIKDVKFGDGLLGGCPGVVNEV